MPSYYFYKTVRAGHILGQSLIPCERGTGIKEKGLDPLKRNGSGGSTQVAAAQTGRNFSSSDKTGLGQCLTGSPSIAIGYFNSDDHVLLRVTLGDDFLTKIKNDADALKDFDSMEDAMNAAECTAMTIIGPESIEYSIKTDKNDYEWAPISDFKANTQRDHSCDW